ncbi:hypothetical protein ACIQOF_18710, partial [Streptomyces sp. NPDC091265]
CRGCARHNQAPPAIEERGPGGDLMQLTNAIALAAEQSPDDPGLAGRLLTLTVQGLRAAQSSPSGD